ncbi:hypothetical protein ACR80S_12935 [Halomonas sp. MA07-2]|uniref:hypothetical protein n=1 Tax=Halomonas sp. MA07-2 TaxID=3440841 RepID=UPI003EF04493
MAEQPRQQGEYEDFAGEQGPSGRSARLIWGLRALGLIMALLVWLAMGQAEGLSSDARWVAAASPR